MKSSSGGPVRLDSRLWFPDPRLALTSGPLNGLVAIGGDLSTSRLVLAYRSGLFPWSVDPITWWSPDPRAVFDLDRWHTSKSVTKLIRKQVFETTIDRAFRAVMERCATPSPGRQSTWITGEFIEAYTALHEAGYAHSVECWEEGDLVGGIYGVAVGGLFSGESMFHRADNASKVALVRLIAHLRERGFRLFDVQVLNPHTERLGASVISRSDYLKRLEQAVAMRCVF